MCAGASGGRADFHPSNIWLMVSPKGPSPVTYGKVFFRRLSTGSFSRISSSLRFQSKDLMWQNKQLGCDSAVFFRSQAYLGGQPLVVHLDIRRGLLRKGAAIL